jgi:hypothetical protein
MKAFILKAGVYVYHTVICTSVIVAILVGFWALSYARSVHQRHRAERLLQQLATVQIGPASFHSVEEIVREFNAKQACKNEICDYDFKEGFEFISYGPMRFLLRTEWDYLGFRPWNLAARIATNGSEVVNVEFSVSVGRGHDWLWNQGPISGNMWAWVVDSVNISPSRFEQYFRLEQESSNSTAIYPGHQIEIGMDGVIVRKPTLDTPGGGKALDVTLSPNATANGRRSAFDINLRCATSLSGCNQLCRLAPSAWQRYEHIDSDGAAEPCAPETID